MRRGVDATAVQGKWLRVSDTEEDVDLPAIEPVRAPWRKLTAK
jgi:hypothetical protein